MTGTQDFSFGKSEKLCSRKIFEMMMQQGQSVFVHPIKAVYLYHANARIQSPLQVAFVVPKRNFKKSTDRNRIKRLMREAYRLHRHKLLAKVRGGDMKMALLLIYVPKNLTNFYEVSQKLVLVLQRLSKHVGV